METPLVARRGIRPRRAPRAQGNAWQVRGTLPKATYVTVAVAGFLTMLGLWWGLSASGAVNPLFLPTPPQVVHRFFSWYREGTLVSDTQISVLRVMGGFVISTAMAIPLGVSIGAFRPVQAFFEPLVEFARYLPAVAFVPLVLLWVGIGEGSKITIIWIGTFFQQVLLIAEDVRRVPDAQIEAAQTMGATRGETLQLVLFKSALPAIVDTLRVTLGWAWTYLVVAELVASNSGLGFAILQAQRFLQTGKILVGILMIGAIGLATDQCMRLIHRFAFPWLHRR